MENPRFKFRVWDIEEWAYLKCKYSKSAGYHKYTFGKHNVWQDIGYFIESNPKYYIIEQCTGLKDKNGNLIYEGDIVLFNDDDYPWQIKWNEVFARWVLYSPLGSNEDGEEELTDTDTEYLKIIGNIHEQAEQKDVK